VKTKDKPIRNCLLYGKRLKTVEEAHGFVRAAGYEGDLNDIAFVDMTKFATHTELVKEIARVTGALPQDVGIRSAEGELALPARGAESAGIVLEVKALKIKGKEVFAAYHSYEALLAIMTRVKSGADAAVIGMLPGVTKDDEKALGIFRYLPPTLPIDYGEEIEAYQTAVKILMSAA
jgi:hypothetical protein